MTAEDLKIIEQINRELLDSRIARKYAAKLELTHQIAEEETEITEITEITEVKNTEKIKEPEKTQKKRTNKTCSANITSVWKDLGFLLAKIISIALVFVLLFTFLFGMIRYNEPSMAPMIKDGDLVIYYRYTKSGYLAQDAVVLDFKGQWQVRRVVATEGDTVDINEHGLIVNGAVQQEPEIYQQTERYEDGIEFPLTVPEGHIFVLGDSRTGATDSRIYGCVNIKDTFGKVMAVIRRRSI